MHALPHDTMFVLATPPAAHFPAALSILEAGRDVIVEKPAFVSSRQARLAVEAAARTGGVLVEGFMHRHTTAYGLVSDEWRQRAGQVRSIEIAFMIPSLPSGTFRQEDGIENSSLYDIGSYAMSLLADFRLPLADLALTEVRFPGDFGREALVISGTAAGVDVSIRIGVGDYENRIVLRGMDRPELSVSPFFYGRPGERTIVRDGEAEALVDHDAFQAMFAVGRDAWLSDQAERGQVMIEIAASLERLGAQLTSARGAERA